MGKFKRGDRVAVLEGCSSWMKKHDLWMREMGKSIDFMEGEVVVDASHLKGDDAYYGVDLGFKFLVGINPKFLKLCSPEEKSKENL
ncbi:MAG: hypothetical protein PWQ06_2790 [Anaerophaga sp.]|nr:hypothetical protein [Anaerophaga sp.]